MVLEIEYDINLEIRVKNERKRYRLNSAMEYRFNSVRNN